MMSTELYTKRCHAYSGKYRVLFRQCRLRGCYSTPYNCFDELVEQVPAHIRDIIETELNPCLAAPDPIDRDTYINAFLNKLLVLTDEPIVFTFGKGAVYEFEFAL